MLLLFIQNKKRIIYEIQLGVMKNTIYQCENANVRLMVVDECQDSFVEVVENAVWGASGVLYKMNDLRKEFEKFEKLKYVHLEVEGELVAVCALNHKVFTHGNESIDAFYLFVLAVVPAHMNRGYAGLIVSEVTKYLDDSHQKLIVYAYVEDDNEVSKRVFLKTGYHYLTQFIAASNVNLFPKSNPHVAKLTAEDKPQLIALLKEQCKGNSFVDIDSSFDANEYYVYKQKDIICAGVQVKVLNWTFISLVGLEGFLMMKVVPYVPLLKKVFNAKNHSFLKIGNMLISDKQTFVSLINAVMKMYNIQTSIAYVNPASVYDENVLKIMKKGLLSSSDTKVLLYYHAKNVDLDYLQQTTFLSLDDSL